MAETWRQKDDDGVYFSAPIFLPLEPVSVGRSGNFLHRTGPGAWERTTLGLKMADHLIDHFAEFGVKPNRIVAVYPRDEVRALANISLIFRAPLNPFVVLIAC